ncbi:MAG: ATP-binding cassette domain-containing protein [Candidatus Aenigmatarchaeota archaeon]
MHVIEIKNLTKKFKNLVAVDNLNLNVEQGEILGLLGPNGAGKTTTLLMLTTLRSPTSGNAIINGHDILKHPDEVRKSIGIVFQDPSSDDILTGRENLILHGLLYGLPRNTLNKKIDEVLELVDLTDRQNDLVKKYSGGMRRRLEIARGLMHHPKVLFLDEPTLGLDPQSRENIWKYVAELKKERNMTIILTTHYMDEADRLCDRIAIMDKGKIVALDSPSKLKHVLSGDIIKLKVARPNIEKMKKMKFVKKVEYSDGELILTVKDAEKNIQTILRNVGKVKSVEIHEPTLNDVFLHYTGREIKEESPEGGWAERAMHMRSKR